MHCSKIITENLLTGQAVADRLDALASLRLDIFQEYPYLYSGRREDELSYLAGYAEKLGACVILAEEDGAVIGAATGMPLAHEDASLRVPFAEMTYRQSPAGSDQPKPLKTKWNSPISPPRNGLIAPFSGAKSGL